MPETTEIVPKTIENPKKRQYPPIQNPTARHDAVKALLENSSLTSTQISQQLGYNPSYIRELKKKLCNTTIITNKIKRLAKKRLTEILEREPSVQERVTKEGAVIEFKDYPTHGNVLDAIGKVVDRTEPITQKVDITNTFELGERLERAMQRRKSEIEGNTDNSETAKRMEAF